MMLGVHSIPMKESMRCAVQLQELKLKMLRRRCREKYLKIKNTHSGQRQRPQNISHVCTVTCVILEIYDDVFLFFCVTYQYVLIFLYLQHRGEILQKINYFLFIFYTVICDVTSALM